jgi:hypothetical protein
VVSFDLARFFEACRKMRNRFGNPTRVYNFINEITYRLNATSRREARASSRSPPRNNKHDDDSGEDCVDAANGSSK